MTNVGQQYIKKGGEWSYCFPSGSLASFTLTNKDGNSWVGDISITHDDPKYSTMMECEKCLCECGEKKEKDYKKNGCGSCQQQKVIDQFGIDDDDDVVGDTKCLNGDSCPFTVSWTVSGNI